MQEKINTLITTAVEQNRAAPIEEIKALGKTAVDVAAVVATIYTLGGSVALAASIRAGEAAATVITRAAAERTAAAVIEREVAAPVADAVIDSAATRIVGGAASETLTGEEAAAVVARPVVAEDAAVVARPVVAEDAAVVARPVAAEDAAVVARPVSAEDAAVVARPVAAEDAAVVARPVAAEDAAVVARPVAAEDAAVVARPVAAEDAAVVARPVVAEDAAVVARPVVAEDAAVVARPVAAEDAAVVARPVIAALEPAVIATTAITAAAVTEVLTKPEPAKQDVAPLTVPTDKLMQMATVRRGEGPFQSAERILRSDGKQHSIDEVMALTRALQHNFAPERNDSHDMKGLKVNYQFITKDNLAAASSPTLRNPKVKAQLMQLAMAS